MIISNLSHIMMTFHLMKMLLVVWGWLFFYVFNTVSCRSIERKNILKIHKGAQITFSDLWNSTGYSVSNDSLVRDVLIDQIQSNTPEYLYVQFKDLNTLQLWSMRFTTDGVNRDLRSWMKVDNLLLFNRGANIKGNITIINTHGNFSLRNISRDNRVYVFQGQIGYATSRKNVILFTRDGYPHHIPSEISSSSIAFQSDLVRNDSGMNFLSIMVNESNPDAVNFVNGISISSPNADVNYTFCYHFFWYTCDGQCNRYRGKTGTTNGNKITFDVIRPRCIGVTFVGIVREVEYTLYRTGNDLIPAHYMIVSGRYRVSESSSTTDGNSFTSDLYTFSTVTEQSTSISKLSTKATTVSWNSKNGWNNVTASTVTEQDTSLYQNSVTTVSERPSTDGYSSIMATDTDQSTINQHSTTDTIVSERPSTDGYSSIMATDTDQSIINQHSTTDTIVDGSSPAMPSTYRSVDSSIRSTYESSSTAEMADGSSPAMPSTYRSVDSSIGSTYDSSSTAEMGQQTTSNTVLNTCCCLFKNIYGNMTDAQIIERIKMNLLAIQANLAINKDILSRTIRTKTCANDDRISSKIYGYFAGFIIGFILFLICISDISNLAKLALNHSRKTKRLQTDSSYTF